MPSIAKSHTRLNNSRKNDLDMTSTKLLILICSITLVISCQRRQQEAGGIESIVEVITNDMDFELPDEIPSGWHTFRYVNNSDVVHFFVFEKMPEGVRIENYRNELLPPFLKSFQYLDSGNTMAGMKEFGKFPKWFGKIEYMGGIGLTSPKSTTECTLYLEPGIYVLECYVRLPNGVAHAFVGMTKELVVTEEENNFIPDHSDYQISISGSDGITFVENIPPGQYTFSVEFEDQRKYLTLLGHDVHLVKLEDPTALDSLAYWIDASDVKAFRTPAPRGLIFMGGVQDLPEGRIGYFNASLEKGEYVLISEIPNAVKRNMFRKFSVTE